MRDLSRSENRHHSSLSDLSYFHFHSIDRMDLN